MLCIELFCIFSRGTKRITCGQLLTKQQVAEPVLSQGAGDRKRKPNLSEKTGSFLISECHGPCFLMTVFQVSGKGGKNRKKKK